MSDVRKQFWGQKTYCLVTGASRGIGRKFAEEFSRRFASGSMMLLLARSGAGLTETLNIIEKVNTGVDVVKSEVDLSKPDPNILYNMIDNSLKLKDKRPDDFELAILIHNVGSVGDVSEGTLDMSDPKKWQDYFSLNVFSVACLNSQFFKVFPEGSVKQRVVINVTSLCALKPFKSMGYYCSGKAAREIFFKTFAEENPNINVLNYAPGPVDTDMVAEVISGTKEDSIREMFETSKKNKTILSVADTTNRLIEVLEKGNYESGQHVDYFDE